MKINGVTIRTPTELKVGTFRISKSERTADGAMTMDIIAVKRRLDLTWSLITSADLQQIMSLLAPNQAFHTIVYPDPENGETATITAYLGDTGQEVGQQISGTRYWRDVQIALIER